MENQQKAPGLEGQDFSSDSWHSTERSILGKKETESTESRNE